MRALAYLVSLIPGCLVLVGLWVSDETIAIKLVLSALGFVFLVFGPLVAAAIRDEI